MSFTVLDDGGGGGGGTTVPVARMRLDVVKSTDSNRGFRLFDNAVFTVRDVASEELFLDRVRIAYGVFDVVVRPYMEGSLTVLAKRLVLATRICVSRYFDRQSMARSNRPFVVEAEYRDSASLFCACSDFLRTYLYTRTENEGIRLSRNGGATERRRRQPVNDFLKHLFKTTRNKTTNGGGDRPDGESERVRTEECHVQKLLGTLEARLMIEGGLASDLADMKDPDALYSHATDYREYGTNVGLDDGPPGPEAVLYVIADMTALAEFIGYMFFMTPMNLKRRYEVRTGCLAAPTIGADTDDNMSRRARLCCREKSERYSSSDTVHLAISEFIRRQQGTATGSSGVRSTDGNEDDENEDIGITTDPKFTEFGIRHENTTAAATRATRLRKRNEKLVKNLLLLLFDKSLSSIVDNGFDNANRRRRYGTDSKSLGGATIYTGILDTVGKVNVRYGEGTFLSRKNVNGATKLFPRK